MTTNTGTLQHVPGLLERMQVLQQYSLIAFSKYGYPFTRTLLCVTF